MYGSTLSLTSVLDGGEWSRPCLAPLSQGKTWHPLCRRLGVPQGHSGWVRKMFPPPGFDPQTVQPMLSCCTGYAIPSYYL